MKDKLLELAKRHNETPGQHPTYVWVCIVEPEAAYAYSIFGQACKEDIKQAEGLAREGAHQFGHGLPVDAIGVLCELVYETGERQPGSGYGDVLEIPGYFHFEPVQPLVLELAPEAWPEAEDNGNLEPVPF